MFFNVKKKKITHQEKSTQTARLSTNTRIVSNVKIKDGFKFISSLLLPLVLGVFTFVVTFHQQDAAKQQREED